MAFKVGDVVRLKSGGALMTISKLFKSSEGREMVQCTWVDKPKEHRAAFAIDSLEVAERRRRRRPKRHRGAEAVGSDGFGCLELLSPSPTSSALESFRSIARL